jgi:hypothetical protein
MGHPSGLVRHAKDKCRIKDLSLVDQLHDRNLTSFRRSVKSFATVRLANGGLMHRSLAAAKRAAFDDDSITSSARVRIGLGISQLNF